MRVVEGEKEGEGEGGEEAGSRGRRGRERRRGGGARRFGAGAQWRSPRDLTLAIIPSVADGMEMLLWRLLGVFGMTMWLVPPRCFLRGWPGDRRQCLA